MAYLNKHWRGKLSLAISFWVNFIFLNIILNIIVILNLKGVFSDHPVFICRFSIIYGVVCLAIVTPWQLVGLWRSAAYHAGKHNKRFWSILVQIMVVLSLMIRIGGAIYQWPLHRDTFMIAFVKDRFPDYSMNLLADRTVLHFEGGLPFGVSKEFAKVLQAQPGLEMVILDSTGGRVYEARKMAEMILERELNTCTVKGCYSAATLTFAAGKNRYLCKGAQLGFHAYYQPDSFNPYHDIYEDYEKDWAYYQLRGVTREFRDKIFSADPNDYWIPSDVELFNGGMIHNVVKLPVILPMEEAIVFGYDISRKGSDHESYETGTADQLKGWIFGCSGVLWERNRNDFVTLAGSDISKISIKYKKELLSESWGIENRNDLLSCLYGLTQRGGHNDDFLRDGRYVSRMSLEELEDFLTQRNFSPQRSNELRIAHHYYQALGDKGILAWETTRYMFLCRNGYLCGWLDEKTAWDLMIPVARYVRQNFDSWEEMGRNYLIGRQYWSLKYTESDKELYDEAFCRLTEMPSSPWSRYPWDIDLSRAYELIVEPLSDDLYAFVSDSKEPLEDTPETSMDLETPELSVPDLPVPELAEPDLSKVNTLAELEKNGPVWIVPDDYDSIQEAIDAAKDGDTVFIRKGEYNEWLLVKNKKNIRITGENAQNVVLHPNDPNKPDVIRIVQCQQIVLSDMTIDDQRNIYEWKNRCIGVSEGQADILRCRLTNQQGNGICYFSNAKGKVQDIIINTCQGTGALILGEDTEVTIDQCVFRDNNKRGLDIYKGADVTINETLFEKNKYGALVSQERTTAGFKDCVFYDNSENGLSVYNEAQVQVEASLFKSNKHVGIHVTEGTTSTQIDRTWCCGNKDSGIIVNQGASAEISNSKFSENGKSGIRVYSGASATICGSSCNDNKQNGIAVYNEGTTAVINKNRSFENQYSGINVFAKASAQLVENQCFRNGHHGILFFEVAIGSIENCFTHGNTRSGIYVSSKETQAKLLNNKCHSNTYNGIVVCGGAQASVQLVNNRCLGNYPSGISIAEGSVPVLTENVCSDNPWAGIAIKGQGTNPSIVNNELSGNGTWGIRIWNGAKPDMSKNTIENNGKGPFFYVDREEQELLSLAEGDQIRAEENLRRSFQLDPYQSEVAGELGRMGIMVQIPRKEADNKALEQAVEEEQ